MPSASGSDNQRDLRRISRSVPYSMPHSGSPRSNLFPTAPLPGTEPPARALFIDRWGTLLTACEAGGELALEFVPGARDALFRASRAGWKLYLIGNEDGVARGRIGDAAWKDFEERLAGELRAHGVVIQRHYACLDHPDGKAPHKKNSVFRLPDTGVFFHAAQNDGVQLSESWVIGDSSVELVAGIRAGCRALAVKTGRACLDRTLDVDPHAEAASLVEAIALFLASEAYARA